MNLYSSIVEYRTKAGYCKTATATLFAPDIETAHIKIMEGVTKRRGFLKWDSINTRQLPKDSNAYDAESFGDDGDEDEFGIEWT